MPPGRVIRAVDHPYRRNMLHVLAREACTYSQLFASMEPRGGGRGRFNYHLKILREAGLIKTKESHYGLSGVGEAAVAFLEEVNSGSHRQARWRIPRRDLVPLFGASVLVLVFALLLTIVLSPIVSNPPSPHFPLGWNAPELVSRSEAESYVVGWQNGENGARPQVAVDTRGNALVAWRQIDGVWANRFEVDAGWDRPSLLWEGDIGATSPPRLAISPDGNGVVFWHGGDGNGEFLSSVWASHFVPGLGWGTATLIDARVGEAFIGDIALDAGGTAMAVWLEKDGYERIMSNRFLPDMGWTGPELVEARAGSVPRGSWPYLGAVGPIVEIDSEGRALVVWTTTGAIHASRYVPATGWEPSVIIGTGDRVSEPSIAVDSVGNGLAVWLVDVGDSSRVYASRFEPGLGWAAAVSLDPTANGDPVDPQVALDDQGNALVVWLESRPGEQWADILASRLAPGLGWSSPMRIADKVAGPHIPWWSANRTDFTLAMEPSGNAAVVWDDNGTFAIRFSPVYGWGRPAMVSPRGNVWCFDCPPGVAVDPFGNVVAVWEQVGLVEGQEILELGIKGVRSAEPTHPDLQEELRQNRDALQDASGRLADLTGRFIVLGWLFAALAALTAVLFALYWIPRRSRVSEREMRNDGGRYRKQDGEGD